MRYRFGHYVLDEDARELRLDGREIEVQPLVFDLLRYLVVHRDRVVTKQELLDMADQAMYGGKTGGKNCAARFVKPS